MFCCVIIIILLLEPYDTDRATQHIIIPTSSTNFTTGVPYNLMSKMNATKKNLKLFFLLVKSNVCRCAY